MLNPRDIETAVLAAINAPPLNVYCKNFKVWESEFADEGALDRFAGTFPVCFVYWGGFRREEAYPQQRYWDNSRVSVIVADKNLRGIDQAKNNAGGAYDLIKDVDGLLQGNNLGGIVEPLTGIGATPLRINKSMAVYGLDYEVKVLNPQ